MTAVAVTTTRRASTLTGLRLTTRFAWRRSRVFLSVWVLALWTLIPITISQYAKLVPNTAGGLETAAALGSNPTMRALLGPPYDLLHKAPFAMFRVGTFAAAAAGFMAALGVIRATRAEEEEGRVELLRAGALGRHAPLAGGIVSTLGACAALGVLTTLTVWPMGAPLAGSVCCGLGLALTGATFVGVGALTAQIFESARSARFAALGGALTVSYLVRAMADAASDTSRLRRLQWISPVEWAALARPWVHERWWVLLLPVVLTAVLIWLALALETHRDHGAGLLAERPGPARGAAGLRDAASLARRLQRGSLIGWTVGMLLTALVLNQLVTSLRSFLNDNTSYASILRKMSGGAQNLTDAFTVAMLGVLVVVIGMMGLQLMGRLTQEESRGQAELVLSTATSRRGFALSHLSLALLAPSLIFVLTAALMTPGSGRPLGTMLGSGAALLPALWFTVALDMALVGWAPRLTWIVWAVLGWSLFLTWVAGLIGAPGWVLKLSAFGLLPKLPAEPMRWTWVIVETLVAAALLVVGLIGYQRRNIPAL